MWDPAETRRRRVRFVVTFAICAGVLLTLYSFPDAEHGAREAWFARYLAAYAHLAGAFLRLFDPAVHVVGRQIVGRVSLAVAKNCDAMDVNILFVAAVVAFPARWSRRAVGMAAGTALLAVANVVRIASLYHVDLRWPARFELVHAEIWPLVMVAIALGAFLRWSRWAELPEVAEAADAKA